MDKNIVFIIAVKKDGQLKPEYEIGIESWRRWCKKNDVDLFLPHEVNEFSLSNSKKKVLFFL